MDTQERILASGEDKARRALTSPGYINVQAGRRARLLGPARLGERRWPREREMRRFLFLLEEMLLCQPGVTVKEQSHLAPPYRATPWVAETLAVPIDQALGSQYQNVIAPVYFNGNATFPGGHIGIVAGIKVLCTCIGPIAFDPARWGRWRLLKNGVPQPGYNDRVPDSALYLSAPAPPAVPIVGREYTGPMGLPPVHLREFDELVLQCRGEAVGGAYQHWIAGAYVWGYFYPARLEDNSARGQVTS